MTGFYITKLRLLAPDFPGQMKLFTNLKKHVYFRNATLDFISSGGWAELPEEHVTSFLAALKEGWVKGERNWSVNYHQFTRRWSLPSWVRDEQVISPDKILGYVSRCQLLLDRDITNPLINYPVKIPSQVIELMVKRLEDDKTNPASNDYYTAIDRNLESFPNKEIASRAYTKLHSAAVTNNLGYSQMTILDRLSSTNGSDRKKFLSWLFQSPEQLAKIRAASYDVSDIIMRAVENGEVWYTEALKPVQMV